MHEARLSQRSNVLHSFQSYQGIQRIPTGSLEPCPHKFLRGFLPPSPLMSMRGNFFRQEASKGTSLSKNVLSLFPARSVFVLSLPQHRMFRYHSKRENHSLFVPYAHILNCVVLSLKKNTTFLYAFVI